MELHGYFFEKKKTLDDEFNSENGVSNFAFGEGIKVKKKKKPLPRNPPIRSAICTLGLQALGLFLTLVIPEAKMTSSSR